MYTVIKGTEGCTRVYEGAKEDTRDTRQEKYIQGLRGHRRIYEGMRGKR